MSWDQTGQVCCHGGRPRRTRRGDERGQDLSLFPLLRPHGSQSWVNNGGGNRARGQRGRRGNHVRGSFAHPLRWAG